MNRAAERHLLIKDDAGAVVVSTVPPECAGCPPCETENELTRACTGSAKRRRGSVSSTKGSVYFCTSDSDLVASSRLFKRELELYRLALDRFDTLKSETVAAEAHKTRRLLHNLISLNAHALQELYSVVSQEKLGSFAGYRSQKEFLTTFLRQRPDEAAEIFLRSLKNAAAVKIELAVFQKLYEPSPKLQFGWHEVHRVLRNVGNYFFQDFSDQQVKLQIENCETKLRLDYESIQVAFYHMLENAVKYALPSSDVRISFLSSDEDFCLLFDMTSLFVEPSERQNVFLDGVSGAQAKALNKAGQGLGMKLIEELLRLNEATLAVKWGDLLPLPADARVDSPRYAQNRLIVSFPKRLVRS